MLLIAATVVSPSFKLWNLFEGSRGGCTAWWMLEKSSVRELLSERYPLHHDRGRELTDVFGRSILPRPCEVRWHYLATTER
jgi:hypothetical protein